MTSRQRVNTALQHKEPDRVPFDLGSRSSAIEIEAYRDLRRFLDMPPGGSCFIRSHAEIDEPVAERLRIDTRWIRSIPSEAWSNQDGDDIFTDRWGVPWRKKKGQLYYELDHSPLAEKAVDDLGSSVWPPLVDDETLQDMAAKARNFDNLAQGAEYSLSCDLIGAGVVERAWYLRGFENFMLDMMCEEKATHAYLRRIVDHQLAGYEAILGNIGNSIETVWITDDIATQESLMFSPDLYRRLIKPYQKELLDFIQSAGVKVVFHSCGAVRPLLPDLIEIGVRIFHPLQTTARNMDPVALKRDFGQELVFWGGGCETETLQFGTQTEVEEEVKQRIDILAPGGGFIFCPTHCIQPHTPPENIITMVDALYRYGGYG